MFEIFSTIPAGGSVFNALAVIIGSSIGLFAGKFIPEKLKDAIFSCLGLFTLYIGINMALSMKHSIAVLLSLVLGSITGYYLGLEDKLNTLGDKIRARIHSSDSKFTEGFVTSTLLFCVGAMAIIGSFEDGLRHNPEILITKGIMDGVAASMFAGTFGIGVMFSAPALFIYQGIFTLAGSFLEPFITPDMYANISGIGGLMIMGIGFNLMKITRLKLSDMLPGLIYIFFMTMLFA